MNNLLAREPARARELMAAWEAWAKRCQVVVERSPNVLFILCDDLRPDALGGFGSQHMPTPHIDALARGGVRFANAFCTTSLCSPSRASILELCGAPPLANIQGRSWRALAYGSDPAWRKAWFYEYNYEKQFPYTPNIRGLRTGDWKFIRYPHGDGSPDRHLPELYWLKNDPGELHNLALDPQFAAKRQELEQQLSALLAAEGLTPDRDLMPMNEGIKSQLPDQKIR